MVAWCSLVTLVATINVRGRSLIDVIGDGSGSLAADMILIGMAALLGVFVVMHLMVLLFKTKGGAQQASPAGYARILSVSDERPADGSGKANGNGNGASRLRIFGKRKGGQNGAAAPSPPLGAGELQMTAITPGSVHEMTPEEFRKISTDKRQSVKNPLFDTKGDAAGAPAPEDRQLATLGEVGAPGSGANGDGAVSEHLSV